MGDKTSVLSVKGLNVSFQRPILRDVSFGLMQGEFCGLIGSNGSGKTTLLRTLLGLQRVTSGHISFANKPPSIGYVPQKTVLDPQLPLRTRDLVSLGLDGHRLGLPLPSRKRDRMVDEMLAAVGAQGFADQRVGRLSGGQQQRALIAHALIRRPAVLLLDEPLSSLDPGAAAEVVVLLDQLRSRHGITILLSAHDMNPLLPVMNNIIYLAHGRAASGSAEAVVRTEVLSQLYGYHIDVIRVHGRVLVVAAGAEDETIIGQHPHVLAIP